MTERGELPLIIDAGAVDWIQRHGGVVTLRRSPRHGCCGGTALLPVAETRTPATIDDWIKRQIDGVTVYIDRDLAARTEPLTIRAEGFRQWRRLFVENHATQS